MFYVANIGIYRRNYLVEDYEYEDEFKELYNNIENDELKKLIIHNEQSKFKNADHDKKENDSPPTNNSKLNDKNEELKSPSCCMNTSNKK